VAVKDILELAKREPFAQNWVLWVTLTLVVIYIVFTIIFLASRKKRAARRESRKDG
jgi:uncharacterized membrane protein SirB2